VHAPAGQDLLADAERERALHRVRAGTDLHAVHCCRREHNTLRRRADCRERPVRAAVDTDYPSATAHPSDIAAHCAAEQGEALECRARLARDEEVQDLTPERADKGLQKALVRHSVPRALDA
jgi:restriction endonuclease Mrr